MAQDGKPQSVLELSRLLNIPLDDCLVPCNFCRRFLSYTELTDFDNKRLSLIWKGDLVFACCRSCCVATATFEFDQYFVESVIGWEIEHKEGTSISDIIVRCHHCLTLLNQIEKLDICGRSQLFHRVRRGWKGLCRQCKQI